MPFNFAPKTSTHQTASHIPQNPTWFFPIRLVQGLLALITLALSAYVISDTNDKLNDVTGLYYWNGVDATGMNIWTSIFTFIYLAYIFLTAVKFAQWYNNWAVMVLEILLLIFWLITFAMMADIANDGHAVWKLTEGQLARDKASLNALTAATVLAAFNFVLFCVTCVFFGLSLKKHRAAGHPMTAPTTSTGGVQMQNVNPATGTSPANNGQYANQPVGDQQYPAATYNQPVYNQQGHNAV